jgi:hypothetical protein
VKQAQERRVVETPEVCGAESEQGIVEQSRVPWGRHHMQVNLEGCGARSERGARRGMWVKRWNEKRLAEQWGKGKWMHRYRLEQFASSRGILRKEVTVEQAGATDWSNLV